MSRLDPTTPRRTGWAFPAFSRAEWAGLAALLLFAAALRAHGLTWGLPELFEEATPFRKAVAFWGARTGRLSLDPHFYNYPSLTFYLHFLAQMVYGFARALGGAWRTLDEFRSALAARPAEFILLSRVLNAGLSALTIVPVYRLGRSLGGVGAAWGAALIMAAAPLVVAPARAIATDVPLCFATAWALVALLDVDRRGLPSDYRRAGVWIGLAASAKYPGAWLLLPLFAIHWVGRRPPESGGKPLRHALIAAGLVFAATSPFVLLNLPEAFTAVGFEQHHMRTGHFGGGTGWAAGTYLTQTLPLGFGWPLYAGLVAALIWSVAAGGAIRWIAGYALAVLALLGSWRVAADRYLLLAAPALAVVAGVAAARLTAALGPSGIRAAAAPGEAPRGRRAFAAALLVALLLSPALPVAWRQGSRAGQLSTRVEAAEWVRRHVRKGTPIAVENYSVEAVADSFPTLIVPFDAVNPHTYDPAYSLPFYAPFDYVVLSSTQYDRYLATPRQFPAQVQFYEGLARERNEVARFEPGPGRVGPTLRIFQRRPGARQLDFRSVRPEFYDRIDDRRAMAHFMSLLGATLRRAGEVDLALVAAERAAQLDPTDARIWMNLGTLEEQRGDLIVARKTYQKALELSPKDPRLLYNLGHLAQGQTLYDEAIGYYASSLRLNPRLAEAYLALAICQVKTSRFGPAEIILNRFLEHCPDDPRTGQARAMLKELESLRR